MDDFGTGYLSLTHLRRIPVNTIRLDQLFVQGMLDDASDSSILEGIIGLAKAFKCDVVTEGSETKVHACADKAGLCFGPDHDFGSGLRHYNFLMFE